MERDVEEVESPNSTVGGKSRPEQNLKRIRRGNWGTGLS